MGALSILHVRFQVPVGNAGETIRKEETQWFPSGWPAVSQNEDEGSRHTEDR